MAELKDVTVSLRVFGDELEPSEVSNLLEAAPSDSRRAGDPTNFRTGPTRYELGAWLLRSDPRADAGLEAHIRSILDATTADLDRWQELTRRFDVDLFCGVFLEGGINQSIELSPDLLSALGDRRLTLALDLYGGEEWED